MTGPGSARSPGRRGGSAGRSRLALRRAAATGWRSTTATPPDLADAVAASLPGDGHAVVSGDIADPGQVASMAQAAAAALGGIDVLVNNAGVYAHQPIAAATSYGDWQAGWRRVIDTNVLGSANVTWCITDHLLNRPEGPAGPGSSVWVRAAPTGASRPPAYGAAKAALHAMTQSLAVDLAPHGIAVAAVAPGFTGTEMAESVLSGPGGDGIRAQSPFGRVAEADEIASAVAWLASPLALWASGPHDLNGAPTCAP